MDVKGHSGKVASKNGKQFIGNGKKDNSCYKVAKNLARLYSTVLWKVELTSSEIEYIAEISKQSTEDERREMC